MLFYIAAFVIGVVRWPLWALVLLLAARIAWLVFVDLPGFNAQLAPLGAPAVGLNNEAAMIGLFASVVLTVLLYVLGRGARALFDRSRRPS